MNKTKTTLLSAIVSIFLLQENAAASSIELPSLIEQINQNFTVTRTDFSSSIHRISVKPNDGDHTKNKALIQNLLISLNAENIPQFSPLAPVIYFYSMEEKRYETKDNGVKIFGILREPYVPYDTKVHFFKTFPLQHRERFISLIFNTCDFLQKSPCERANLISFLTTDDQKRAFIKALSANIVFEVTYTNLVPDSSNPHEGVALSNMNRILQNLVREEKEERKSLTNIQITSFLEEIETLLSQPHSILGEEILQAAKINIARFKKHSQSPHASFGEWGNLWSKKAFQHEVVIKDHDDSPITLGRVLQLVFDKISDLKDDPFYQGLLTDFINTLSSDEALNACGNGGFFGFLRLLNPFYPAAPLEEMFDETRRNHFISIELPTFKRSLKNTELSFSHSRIMNLFFEHVKAQKESFSDQMEYDQKFNILAFDLGVRVFISEYLSNFIINGELKYDDILAYLHSLDGI